MSPPPPQRSGAHRCPPPRERRSCPTPFFSLGVLATVLRSRSCAERTPAPLCRLRTELLSILPQSLDSSFPYRNKSNCLNISRFPRSVSPFNLFGGLGLLFDKLRSPFFPFGDLDGNSVVNYQLPVSSVEPIAFVLVFSRALDSGDSL